MIRQLLLTGDDNDGSKVWTIFASKTKQHLSTYRITVQLRIEISKLKKAVNNQYILWYELLCNETVPYVKLIIMCKYDWDKLVCNEGTQNRDIQN